MKICISCGRNNNKYPTMQFDGNECHDCLTGNTTYPPPAKRVNKRKYVRVTKVTKIDIEKAVKIAIDKKSRFLSKTCEQLEYGRYCKYCDKLHTLDKFYITYKMNGTKPTAVFVCKEQRKAINKAKSAENVVKLKDYMKEYHKTYRKPIKKRKSNFDKYINKLSKISI